MKVVITVPISETDLDPTEYATGDVIDVVGAGYGLFRIVKLTPWTLASSWFKELD